MGSQIMRPNPDINHEGIGEFRDWSCSQENSRPEACLQACDYPLTVPHALSKTSRGAVVDSGDELSKGLLVGYILILALSMSMISFTIDPYLPAFPEIGTFFGVTNGVVQASFTGVTVGITLGQLLIGPLSDAYGRRPLLLFSMAGYVVATLLAFVASSIEVFIAMRFFMGFFAAGGDVVGRAIIRDLYRGQPMQRMLARVFLIQALAPILGPILGSQLTSFTNWQAVLLLFACLHFVLLFATSFVLIETLPKARRRSSTPSGIARGFRSVAKDRVFVGITIYAALQLSALFVYLNFAPFIYQNAFGVTPTEFGLWLGINGLALYAGVQFGALVSRFIKGQWLLAITAIAGIVVGSLLLISNPDQFWLVESAFAIQMFTFGTGMSIIPTIALFNHGTEAGTANSLLGVVNFLLASLLSSFYFLLDSSSTVDVGVLILSLFVLSLVALIVIARPWTIPDLRKPDAI